MDHFKVMTKILFHENEFHLSAAKEFKKAASLHFSSFLLKTSKTTIAIPKFQHGKCEKITFSIEIDLKKGFFFIG